MLRFRLGVFASLLVVTAGCGGSTGSSTTASPSTTAAITTTVAETTTTAPATTTTEGGFVVTSEDGDLTVQVPSAAMPEDPGMTIRVLGPDEYPPELASAAQNPDVRIYSVEPEGLVFAAPVTVTRRIAASNLADLEPNEVPTIVLVTRSPDGVYEPYSDLSVERIGGDVFVSGTTTHFSPVIAVRESATAGMTLSRDEIGSLPASMRSVNDILTLGTEVGESISLTTTYRDTAGTDLAPPDQWRWLELGGPLGIDADLSGPVASMTCDAIGRVEVKLRSEATLTSNAVAGMVGLRSLPKLAPGVVSLDVEYALDASVACYDPDTSILGTTLAGFSVASDHPGGISWIPNGLFVGDPASGLYASLGPNERLHGVWGGLILDSNGNGIIDSNDAMYQPYPAELTGDAYWYAAPLFSYADYFIYLVDSEQYTVMPTGSDWDVFGGLAAFRDAYTGTGRVESSIGIVSEGESPLVHTVDASEEAQEAPDAWVDYMDGWYEVML